MSVKEGASGRCYELISAGSIANNVFFGKGKVFSVFLNRNTPETRMSFRGVRLVYSTELSAYRFAFMTTQR